MSIQKFDAKNLTMLRTELETAIAAVCNKHGIEAPTLGRIGYTDTSFNTSKLVFQTKSKILEVLNAEPTDLIGKRFKSNGRIFTIKTDNGDNTFIGTTQHGKGFKLRLDQISSMIQL